MGQSLSEPVTHKETQVRHNSDLWVACSSMQGWRVHMEDAFSLHLHLPNDRSASYFAVFDGHGGSKVAKYAASHLHHKITNQPAYQSADIPSAMRRGFLVLDEEMQTHKDTRDELAGSTALVIIIKDQKIYCANCGDSRAVASVRGQAVELSRDHKPSLESEKSRIIAAGGWVDLNRVNGNLALSRALGDFVFKRNAKRLPEDQIVTANPDVISMEINDDLEFIVMACDGIWDVLTNQEVINFVRPRLGQGMDPDLICEELMMQCLAPDCHNSGLGCDNMTVIIVCFLHQHSCNLFQEQCSRPPRSTSVYLP